MNKIGVNIIYLFVLTILVSSCNLFRYGIEERKREKEKLGLNKGIEEEKKKGENKYLNKKEHIKTAEKILSTARQYDGAPYKLGGESKKGIDCSALVMISYKNVGIDLPRTSIEQSKVGKSVSVKEALPGDLIFFKFKKYKNHNPVNHVGIVTKVSNNTVYFYHASTSLGVTESSLAESYYSDVFVKVMRVY